MTPLTLKQFSPAPAIAALVALNHGARRDRVLVFLHGPGCPDCAQLAAQMTDRRADWEEWGTDLVVLHESPEAFGGLAAGQIQDVNGDERQRYAGTADVALAAIEPQGRLMDGWRLNHPDPVDWNEVAATVRWMATQDTECRSWDTAWNENQ